MPYIDRDPSGNIIGIYANAQRENHEYVESASIFVPQPKPQSVTMRQARKALLMAGKLSQVESAIASMTGVQGEEARIEWEYSNEVLRSQPLTVNLAAALGMTDQEMDELFTLASTL